MVYLYMPTYIGYYVDACTCFLVYNLDVEKNKAEHF